MTEFHTVAKVGSISVGGSAAFQVGDRLVAVFNVEGRYYAIDDCCPHMGASLSAGLIAGEKVICPWHAWRFRVTDGTWLDNPKVKTDSFEVRIEGDEIQVATVPKKVVPIESARDKLTFEDHE